MSSPSSSRVQEAVALCGSMRPELPAWPSDSAGIYSFDNIRSELENLKSNPANTKQRMQLRKLNERKMEESVRKLCAEFTDFSNKLAVIASTLSVFVDRFQDFERRLVALEVSRETTLAPTYAQVIQENPSTDAQSVYRIDKSEFLASGNEQRNRM